MTTETMLYWTVLGLLVAQRLVRLPRHRLLSLNSNSAGLRRHAIDGTMLLLTKLSIISVFLVYFLLPETIGWLSMDVPLWLRIVGGIFGAAGVVLLWWADETLAENLSVSLQIRPEQTLVTTGPYRWICHPVYTSNLIFFGGVSLLASNWLVAVTCIGTISVFCLHRIPLEERMMLDHFGEPYREYLNKTGRLLPHLRSLLRID